MAVIYIIETKCDNVVLIGLHSVNMCTYCIVVGVIININLKLTSLNSDSVFQVQFYY